MPTSASPLTRICVPSLAPAGMLMLSVRRVATRPAPLHSVQGWGIVSPKPWQFGQGAWVCMRPKREFWICVTKPDPWQVPHCSGEVPGWHMEPWQVSQDT